MIKRQSREHKTQAEIAKEAETSTGMVGMAEGGAAGYVSVKSDVDPWAEQQ